MSLAVLVILFVVAVEAEVGLACVGVSDSAFLLLLLKGVFATMNSKERHKFHEPINRVMNNREKGSDTKFPEMLM